MSEGTLFERCTRAFKKKEFIRHTESSSTMAQGYSKHPAPTANECVSYDVANHAIIQMPQ